MNDFFHYTNYNNIDYIRQQGLVPQIGPRSESIGDKRCGVFLSRGMLNSITMYASMFNFYNIHGGENGLKEIANYKNDLHFLQMSYNLLDEETKETVLEKIYELNWKIKRNENVIACGSFYNYLGGYGYCLTVDNLDYDAFKDPVDYYYLNTIPPENIKVLVLKNINTNQIIDSREAVLLYGMKDLLSKKEFNNDTRYSVDIDGLYEYLMKNSNIDYDLSEYKLEEYSLQFYNYEKHALKPLIIKPLTFN